MDFSSRDQITFPAGNNDTDTLLGDHHFNLTTLEHWNYTLYNNHTVSNYSKCYLTFEPYTPVLLYPNGTWINGTSCYTPVNGMGTRGAVGVAFACLFGLSLVAVCVNLNRHGKMHLPREKRFYPIGRRWQWYWGSFICGVAIISLFTGIDVDRYYLPQIPIVLNVFFWFLMQMGTMACVWEAARHWGSWMERQYIDPDPFVLQQTDKRGMFEFWLPLFFYLWLWLNFFLIVPRSWTFLELQRSPEQTREVAEVTATNGRFKAAAFCLLICWLTTFASLWHSIKHYEARNRGVFNRVVGGLGYLPFRFVLMMPLGLAVVAYQALCAWQFWLSPLKVDTNEVAMYVGGYLPSLLVLVIQIIAGFLRPNEDRELIRQRRERGNRLDSELGIRQKPSWWRRVNGDIPSGGMLDRIMRNVREVGGGRATGKGVEAAIETRAREVETADNTNSTIEMTQLGRTNSVASSIRAAGLKPAPPPYTPYVGKSEARRNERAMQVAAGLLFPNASPPPIEAGSSAPPSNDERDRNQQAGELFPCTNERSNISATSASLGAPPQQVRSMLDV